MRYLMLSIIVCIGFLASCEKDNSAKNTDGQLDTLLIIGNAGTSAELFDTIIYPTQRCDSILYHMDIDSDSVNDFDFYIYYCYSPCIYMSDMRIDCLTDKCKILCNDTLQTPAILELGDTLRSSGNWISQRIHMLSTSNTSEFCGGDEVTHFTGNWHDLTNKYIGFMVEKDDNILLGWIKISINKSYKNYPIELHEIAYKKVAHSQRS